MAFYMQNTIEGDRRAQQNQGSMSFGDNVGVDPYHTIFNYVGSFTGLWSPQRSRAQNEASGARGNRGTRGGGGQFAPSPNSTPAPAGLAAANDRPYNPYTPNPWGISPYEMRQNPQKYNQGQMYAAYEGRRYLGGYSDDYVSRTTVPVPYGSDNLSLRYFHNANKSTPVYGKPVYREGDEANFAARLSVDNIRQWQSFFQAMGFKTGYAGIWSQHEADAMRHLMTMANGVPGGGMTVDTLRARVEADVTSGVLAPGQLAGVLGSTNLNPLGEAAMGEGTAGGAGTEQMPYTQTTTETQYQELSPDQALLALRQSWMEQYGRAPSQDEISRLLKAANAAFRADPTVITTVMNVDPMAGTTNTETTREESGVDPNAMALEQSTQENEERSEYQANRYLGALMSELGL